MNGTQTEEICVSFAVFPVKHKQEVCMTFVALPRGKTNFDISKVRFETKITLMYGQESRPNPAA